MKEDLGLQRGNGVMLVISEKEKNMLKEIIQSILESMEGNQVMAIWSMKLIVGV